ncbi:MAG: YggS family pyridoxal phosphate-dependent enzyme [Alphaproteobacteria bacterium]|nr:YggS family pyridoxal phosphate-dependent enzyme [Alphaproteobacteria bacterium]
MKTVANALEDVRRRLCAALVEAGRSPDAAELVAVSKTHPAQRIREAVACGQTHFGESYAQELRDKAPELADLGVRWHFIGRIQKNKAKYIAPLAFRVHGVTHVEQAEALAQRAPGPLKVLLNVDVGGEESKVGIDPAELPALADAVARVAGIELVGLMCIPPYTEDPAESGPYFEQLAHLAARENARGHALTELSMGMTHDFPWAVRHGATWVRVGTAIFGPRT